jgi:hypothetical protein
VTHATAPKRNTTRRSAPIKPRGFTVLMAEREIHQRLKNKAQATGRKLEWLTSRLLERALDAGLDASLN